MADVSTPNSKTPTPTPPPSPWRWPTLRSLHFTACRFAGSPFLITILSGLAYRISVSAFGVDKRKLQWLLSLHLFNYPFLDRYMPYHIAVSSFAIAVTGIPLLYWSVKPYMRATVARYRRWRRTRAASAAAASSSTSPSDPAPVPAPARARPKPPQRRPRPWTALTAHIASSLVAAVPLLVACVTGGAWVVGSRWGLLGKGALDQLLLWHEMSPLLPPLVWTTITGTSLLISTYSGTRLLQQVMDKRAAEEAKVLDAAVRASEEEEKKRQKQTEEKTAPAPKSAEGHTESRAPSEQTGASE